MVGVHTAAQGHVAVGVETGHELVALVALVSAGAVLARQRVVVGVGLGFGVGRVAPVAEQGHGAGGAQAGIAAAGLAGGVGGVGLDGQPLGFVEGNAPGRMPGIGGDDDQVVEQIGALHGPLQGLLPAQRAANQGVDIGQPQLLAQRLVRRHQIANGEPWEVLKARLPRGGVGIERPRAAVARAQHVGAHDEPFGGVEMAAWPHQARPPAQHVGIGREGVAHPHHVVAVFVELAPGLVGYVGTG